MPMMYAHKNDMSSQEREARKARSLLKTEWYGCDVGAAVRYLSRYERETGWIVLLVLCYMKATS